MVAAKIVVAGEGLTLCHGQPIRRGPEGGDRYWHAWVEDGDIVVDMSNGLDVEMPRDVYYAIGNIEPDKVAKYDQDLAIFHMQLTEHYGPWNEDEL